jgi:hypothetical protein
MILQALTTEIFQHLKDQSPVKRTVPLEILQANQSSKFLHPQLGYQVQEYMLPQPSDNLSEDL